MTLQDTRDSRRDIIRDFLRDRYHGVIPVTEEMVQAVMDELPARHSHGEGDHKGTAYVTDADGSEVVG